MNVAENLTRTARVNGGSAALALDDAVVTFGQFDEASRRVAGYLSGRGVQRGDRIGVMLPNVPEFAFLYYGVLRAGAVVVPMNPLLQAREVAHCLEDSGALMLFVWESAREAAEEGCRATGAAAVVVGSDGFDAMIADAAPRSDLAAVDSGDVAVILYTSGTTGRPKGAALTHGNLARNAEIVAKDLLELTYQDVIFGGLPLFHSFGQTAGLNAAVRAGACLALLPRFDSGAALAALARHRVTVMQGVPTMYVALLRDPGRADHDLSPLRLSISGGAALPVEVLLDFERTFGCVVLEGYGLSETSPVATFNLPERRRVGSIGLPIAGVDLRVVDDGGADVEPGQPGEILVRGHNVMKGYWCDPEATAATIVGGWLHTGDVGRQDEDGFFYIVDRKKELIIRGGYNVYPREVEEALYEHPAVREAAVIGIPDPVVGEEIAAFVTLRAGRSADADELRSFVKGRVAAYKYPRVVEVVAELPKTSTGKILKREIRAGASR